jgi:AraC-like DNA-binding protein
MYLPFLGSVILEILISFFDYGLNIYNSFLDILVYLSIDIASTCLNVFLIFWGRRLIKNDDTISEEKRRWLLRLNFFIICILAIWILTKFEFLALNTFYSRYLLGELLSLLSWWILYYGVFKLQLIAQKEEIHEYLVSKKTQLTQTKKKIKDTTSSKIITQLYGLMEDEELYKDPLLSRSDLATRLGTSEGYLSQIINQEINKSIIQFVNEYRIEAAKKLLQDPKFNKYSVEAIGMEAGFKSKSAFYSVFNMSLQLSPGAYRKLQKKS